MTEDAGYQSPWRIGVDIGGTFTDVVLIDQQGQILPVKSPTNNVDPAQGVMDALRLTADKVELSLDAVLENCSMFLHGSTIATNTLLERKGAKVGFLTTGGFRDTLEIRRGIRDDPWDHRAIYPEVLVERSLRRNLSERVLADGNVETPLNVKEVVAAAEFFKAQNVDAVAVGLMNSYANDDHELRCRQILEKEIPGLWVSTSASLAPIIGEYERFSTAVVNAYLAPRIVPYLTSLEQELANNGLKSQLLLIQSNGGAISVKQACEKPCALALSGPAAGVGALQWISRAVDSPNLLCIEVGGTSCDVTMMHEGEITTSDQFAVGGHHIALPSVDIHTVSAGGGTISGVDDAGMIFSGPHGAGAVPGPAAYGLGGTEPTITDAQIVLGRLKPGPFANGAITLDGDLAAKSISEKIARPLKISDVDSAKGVVRLMEEHVLSSVQRVSIEKGYDPRKFVLVSGGGAGALHACAVGRSLGCKAVYVPRLAGVMCAFGMCNADVKHDFLKTWLRELGSFTVDEANTTFDELEAEASSILDSNGFNGEGVSIEKRYDLRYLGQQSVLSILVNDLSEEEIVAQFESNYLRQYGHLQEDASIEVVNLRVAAIGRLSPPPLTESELSGGFPAEIGRRNVMVNAKGEIKDVPIFRGTDLLPGQLVVGPCVVEEETTTILVEEGAQIQMDAYSNYIIKFESEKVSQ